jgi:hypothetical protein
MQHLRVSAALLISFACLGLASCGGDNGGGNASAEETAATTAETTTAEAELPQGLRDLEAAVGAVGADELSRQANKCERRSRVGPPEGTPVPGSPIYIAALACIQKHLADDSAAIEELAPAVEEAISTLPSGVCREQAEALFEGGSAVLERLEGTIRATGRVVEGKTVAPYGSQRVDAKADLLRAQVAAFETQADVVAAECA